jgi:NAD(P)-dependent dehydrogenase (short-subunit alcohol dehydrogenase family)
MRQARQGLIVMISSMSGRMALPVLGAYASSKFALEGLSEALRHECRPFGIRVTVVEPGAYDTEMFGRNRRYARSAHAPDGPYAGLLKAADERFQETVKKSMGAPDEVARLVVSLLSKPNPRMRYAIGPGVRLRSAALRLAPYGLVDFLVSRALKSP